MLKVVCQECATEFVVAKDSGRKFCSSSCSATCNNRKTQRRRPKKEHVCKACSKPYYHSWVAGKRVSRKKFCESCAKARESRTCTQTLGESTSKQAVLGKHPSWRSSYVRQHNASYNKDLKTMPCQRCGYSLHTELAHIKGVMTFADDTPLGVINAPENILVLCRNCHWEFDHGYLTLSQVPTRQKTQNSL